MPEIIHAAPVVPRSQIALTAQGLIAETKLVGAVGSLAPLSQAVYGACLGLRSGDVITNIVIDVNVAGVGTAPTSLTVGLASSLGVMLAKSSELKDSAIWTAAAIRVPAPLSAPYTITADGLYYPVILETGTWGTTQMTITKSAFATASGAQALTGFPLSAFRWTGQAALPAVGASLTMVAGDGAPMWFGVN